MVAPQGFEPQLSGPKPDVLPLDERAIYVGVVGLEPTNSKRLDLQSSAVAAVPYSQVKSG